MSQALLGFSKVFTNLDGEAVTVTNSSEITQHGQQIRIRGKGFPDRRYGSRGDLVVTIHIDMPRHLSHQQLQGSPEVTQNWPSFSSSSTFIINIIGAV